jgi:ferric-dicitrate binding protein FerR (iron transport regulator)
VVTVNPSNPHSSADGLAAEQTRVEFAAGRLTIKAPKTWKRYSPFSDGGSVDVRIELPAGSALSGRADMTALQVSGPLGNCQFSSGVGTLQLDAAGSLDLRTGAGDVLVGHVGGSLDVSTGTGKIRIDVIDGSAVIKNSNGDCFIGEAGADLRVNTANGDIRVDLARAAVSAKTAKGDVRLSGLSRGSVVVETGMGELDLGIAEGSAAYLDLHTGFGQVRSELDASGVPDTRENTVEVRGKTGMGDITVRRS